MPRFKRTQFSACDTMIASTPVTAASSKIRTNPGCGEESI